MTMISWQKTRITTSSTRRIQTGAECASSQSSRYNYLFCSEPDVDLENQYYNSKSLKEKDPKAALESFQRVLDLENGEKGMVNINIIVRDHLLLLPPGEWGFKALKQMIKINFRLSNFGEMMTRYDCLFAAHVLYSILC